MLTRHVLSLEAPETANQKILRLVDTSAYTDAIPVKCGRLEIVVPGYNVPVYIEVEKGFVAALTSIDLGLSTTELMDLPDGLYIVRYSVSPNDKVWVEYNILRTTETWNKYMSEVCKLRLGNCEPPADVLERWKDLEAIDRYRRAAKLKTEWCHAPTEGLDLLRYADKLLSKYAQNYCTTC